MVALLTMMVMDISTSSLTSISMSCRQDGGVDGVADDDGVVLSSLISISNQHGLCTKSDLHHIRIVVWMVLLTMMVMDVIEV